MTDEAQAPSELQIQQAIRAAVAAAERGDYAGALKVFNHVYGNPALKPPPDGLSAYGLCVAVEEKQTKKGIELCRAAIAAQFYDARHYRNLVNLHLKKGDRKGAAEALQEGLGRLPSDSSLLGLREKVGLRQPPPVGFLPPGNVINRILLRRRQRRASRGAASGGGIQLAGLHPVVAGAMVLLLFAAVFGVTFYVLYEQAYG